MHLDVAGVDEEEFCGGGPVLRAGPGGGMSAPHSSQHFSKPDTLVGGETSIRLDLWRRKQKNGGKSAQLPGPEVGVRRRIAFRGPTAAD